jgi:hypothetical protein
MSAPRLSESPNVGRGLVVRVGRGEDAARFWDSRWDALLARQAFPNPTLAATWLRTRAGANWDSALSIVVESDGELAAGGAFRIVNIAGSRRLRIATWLGGNGRPTILPDIIADDKMKAAPSMVFQYLLSACVHGVILHPTPTDGFGARALREAASWHVVKPTVPGWVVKLPPPGLEKLYRKVNYRIRRARRLGASIDVHTHADPASVRAGLERLFRLHSQRWHGRFDVSHFSDTGANRARYREVIAAMAAEGRVRIVEVFESGALVASMLGFLAAGGSMFHTTGTRDGGRLRGPGHVAMLAWVEAALAGGAESMHLGRGSCEAEGPKAVLGPTMVPAGFLFGGVSLMSALKLRPMRCERP